MTGFSEYAKVNLNLGLSPGFDKDIQTSDLSLSHNEQSEHAVLQEQWQADVLLLVNSYFCKGSLSS